jgi:anti-sigma B factor antagonist
MPLHVNKRDVDGVTILDFDGRLVVGNEATGARHSFTDAAGSDIRNLIVNLQKVAYIDSTGLGTLIVGHSAMKDVGGAMKLLHLSERHMELMVLSKLTTVFEIFDDEQLAINSFYPDREVKPFDILEFVQSQESDKPHLGANSPEETEPSEA